jgi:phosphonate transport system ATP-binding protein
MSELLVIENLRKTYPNRVEALKGVSLRVSEGEFVSLIGSSGSGKSTLLRCINHLVAPSSGKVIFQGQHTEHARGLQIRRIRRSIGLIFQHYNLIDRLTVIQNVLHGRLGYMSSFRGVFDMYNRQDRWEAYQLLKRVGLSEYLHQRADQLSGGQKQRVGICRALAQKPHLMLADEPIASLDPVSSETVMQHLFNICQADQIAAIVSLHQVPFALRFATRIIGLKDGLIVFDGKPEALDKKMIDFIYEKEPIQGENLELPLAYEGIHNV